MGLIENELRFQLRPSRSLCVFILASLLLLPSAACLAGDEVSSIPYLLQWGIYEMSLETGEISTLYVSSEKLLGVHLNGAGDTFVFSQGFGGNEYEHEEICTLGVDGEGFTRLTENGYLDTYPLWSPDDDRVLFLSWPGETLDIYVMDADGSNRELLYDSGFHDADIDWTGEKIAFTRNSQIWIMNEDGSNATQVTDPPRAGEWGNAVLPFGDYDPRISPDGETIVFERMVDDSSAHGNYDLYSVNVDGSGEAALTDTGWTQGLAAWSPSGERIAYIVSAMGSEGTYDIHIMDRDGGRKVDLTSEIFPTGFLAHGVTFADKSKIIFVGEWWGWEVLESSISCETNVDTITIGEALTVSGGLQPSVPEASISLTYTGPDGSQEVEAVTMGGGVYTHSFEPDEVGSWKVQASWEGDLGHYPSTSVERTFFVEEVAEESSGGGGIPGFPVEAVVLGLTIGLVLIISKRR